MGLGLGFCSGTVRLKRPQRGTKDTKGTYTTCAFVQWELNMKDPIMDICDLVRETSYSIHRYLRSGHLEKVYENCSFIGCERRQ
jgi:hypothetical protein